MNNTIQFTAQDITDKFEELGKLPKEQISDVWGSLGHELLSDLVGAFNDFCFIIGYEDDSRFPLLKSKRQKKHVEELLSKTQELADDLRYLGQTVNKDIPLDLAVYNEKPKIIIADIQYIIDRTPVTNKILEIGSVEEWREKKLIYADNSINLMFYTLNTVFSKDFQKDFYYMKEEVRRFQNHEFETIKGYDHGMLQKDHLINVCTKVDYFRNVLLPFVKNARHHAFKPDGLAGNKFKKESEKYLFVSNMVDEENKEIIISLEDNGTGIDSAVQDKLFQKGVTTKTDTMTDHGIGLWAVRNFVEENGGRIWFETKPGKGTTFKFTIPYTIKEGDNYR